MGNQPTKGENGPKGHNKYYSKRDIQIIQEQLRKKQQKQNGGQNELGASQGPAPKSNSLTRDKGNSRRTMDPGSNESA